MAAKGLRKLVDIHEGAPRLMEALEHFLARHQIAYSKHGHEFCYRYYVQAKDLCCAQAVLPALQDLGRGVSISVLEMPTQQGGAA